MQFSFTSIFIFHRSLKWNFYRFTMFGLSLTAAGVVLVCEMGAPKLDENGKEIEDEFSNMPTVQQYLRRMWRELTFYEKVHSSFLVKFNGTKKTFSDICVIFR